MSFRAIIKTHISDQTLSLTTQGVIYSWPASTLPSICISWTLANTKWLQSIEANMMMPTSETGIVSKPEIVWVKSLHTIMKWHHLYKYSKISSTMKMTACKYATTVISTTLTQSRIHQTKLSPASMFAVPTKPRGHSKCLKRSDRWVSLAIIMLTRMTKTTRVLMNCQCRNKNPTKVFLEEKFTSRPLGRRRRPSRLLRKLKTKLNTQLR